MIRELIKRMKVWLWLTLLAPSTLNPLCLHGYLVLKKKVNLREKKLTNKLLKESFYCSADCHFAVYIFVILFLLKIYRKWFLKGTSGMN